MNSNIYAKILHHKLSHHFTCDLIFIKMARNKHFGRPHRKYGRERRLCRQVRARYFELLNDPFTIDRTILTKLTCRPQSELGHLKTQKMFQ